jgi:hypothetical protein
MYYAKFILDGGYIICADDADYSDYLEKGMRCLVCGRDVHLKKGEFKKPHFAHHKFFDESDLECPLRVMGFSQIWSSLTAQGRGQRRKIFDRHLLNIIRINYTDFEASTKRIKKKTHSLKLELITQQICQLFYTIKTDLIRECRSFPVDSDDNKLALRKLIACEIIDYLSIPYSNHLLKELIHYSIYKCCDLLSPDLTTAVSLVKPVDVCQKLKQIILENDWVSYIAEKLDKNKNYINQKTSTADIETSLAIRYPLLSENELKGAISPFISNEDEFPLFSVGRFQNVKLYLNDLYIYLIIPTDTSNSIPSILAIIKSFSIDRNSQKIIIFWKFVEYNCIEPRQIMEFQKFQNSIVLDKLQITIEEFLKSKFMNNISIKFVRTYFDIPYWGNNFGKDIDNNSSFIMKEEGTAKKLNLFPQNSLIHCPCCTTKLNIENSIRHFRTIHAQPNKYY